MGGGSHDRAAVVGDKEEKWGGWIEAWGEEGNMAAQ